MKTKLLKNFLYYFFPILWAILFVCIGVIPTRLFQNFHQNIPFILVVIFYFALFGSNRLNVLIVFGLGLLTDFLSPSAILGLNAFIYVIMFFMAQLFKSYLYNLSFCHLWIIFCILMLFVDIVWVWLARFTTNLWVTPSFWFVQYLFTCMFYPIIVWITAKLNLYTKDV